MAAAATLHWDGFGGHAGAAEAIWLGGSGQWHDAMNWSTGTVPSGMVDVVIDRQPAIASHVQIDSRGGARGLTIDEGDVLELRQGQLFGISGDLTLNGTLLVPSGDVRFSKPEGAVVSGSGQINSPGFVYMNRVELGPDIRLTGRGAEFDFVTNKGTMIMDPLADTGRWRSFRLLNEGTIEARSGTLHLEESKNLGTIKLASGATLALAGMSFEDYGNVERSAGSTVRIDGMYDNTDQTLTLDDTTGSWILAPSGTIRGGRITTAGEARLIIGGHELSGVPAMEGVTLATDPLFEDQATLYVRNGLTLEGATLDLSAGGTGHANLLFDNASVLGGTGEIVLPDTEAPNGIAGLFFSSQATIGPGIVVRGKRGRVGAHWEGARLINEGTIISDGSGALVETGGPVTNRSLIEGRDGGSLELGFADGGSLENLGTLRVSGGGSMMIRSLSNAATGLVEVTDAPLTLAGDWHNAGTIRVTDGAVNLGGSFELADIGTLERIGTSPISLVGTLENEGQVFTIDPTDGPWTMTDTALPLTSDSGRIRGGTVAAGSLLRVKFGTFENVTLTDDAPRVEPGIFRVIGDLTLDDVVLDLAPGAGSQLALEGNARLIGTGEIVLDHPGDVVSIRAGTSSDATVTIGPDITIRGRNGALAARDSYRHDAWYVNQGRILAEAPGGHLTLESVRNEGEIHVSNGATVTLDGAWKNTAGTIIVGDGKLRVGGWPAWSDEFGSIQRTDPRAVVAVVSSVNNGQRVLDLDGVGPIWLEDGGRIYHGEVRGTGENEIRVDGASGVLEAVAINAPVSVTNDGTLALRGAWSASVPISVTDAEIDLGGAFAADRLAHLHLNGARVLLSGQFDNAGNTLSIQPSAATWTLAGGTIKDGTIQSDALRVDAIPGAMLDGVELQSNLRLLDGASVAVRNTLSIDGELQGTGTVTFAGPGTPTLRPRGTEFLVPEGITLRSGVTAASIGGESVSLTNRGTIRADGFGKRLMVTGSSVRNEGTIHANLGAEITVENSADVADGALLRGTWRTSQSGRIVLPGAELVRNDATIELAGGDIYRDGSTSALSNLAAIGPSGRLSVEGRKFTTAGAFSNEGELLVRSGTFEISGPVSQVVAKTLVGGRWVVEAGRFDPGVLLMPEGTTIEANAADVVLHGAESYFPALDGLRSNTGTLTLERGASLPTARPFTNEGTIHIGPGSSIFTDTGFTQAVGTIGGAGTFLQVGDATSRIGGTQAWQPGATVNVRGGTLHMDSNAGSADAANLVLLVGSDGEVVLNASQHLENLEVEGAVRLPGSGKLLRTRRFTMGGFGKLDLDQNGMLVRATEATRAATLARVTDLVEAARLSEGRWGITSTSAEEDPLTGLAVLLNDAGGSPIIENWGGETLSVNDVLVKYTYDGDANLDGVINADDYFRIDSGFVAQPEDPQYSQGDFNYDGEINVDDYFLIDSSFIGQGRPLGEEGVLAASTSVPEPSGITAMLIIAGALARRQQRPRC